jgi:RNA polymerase sigma-70 factor (ECF subfamily)
MDTSLEKIKFGNKKAFKDFFISSHRDMMRYASFYISDFDVIEDIVQDCYILIWETRETLDINKSLIGYLKQSIKNKCLNYIRHENVKDKYGREVSGDENICFDPIDEETAENIRKLIDNLPATVRKVFELNVVHGLKYSEIAEDMGISVNTVKYHIKVAYRTLRELIKTKEELIYFFFFLKKVKK